MWCAFCVCFLCAVYGECVVCLCDVYYVHVVWYSMCDIVHNWCTCDVWCVSVCVVCDVCMWYVSMYCVYIVCDVYVVYIWCGVCCVCVHMFSQRLPHTNT